MQIRGDISYWAMPAPERDQLPIDDDLMLGLPHDPEWVFIPDHLRESEEAQKLAIVRAHCIEHPEGVLLDVYQRLTELSLVPKYPTGELATQHKLLDGLRDEVNELGQELKIATIRHPYDRILEAMEEDEDVWIHNVLNRGYLRFFQLTPERKEHFLSEAGDVLWYASRVAAEMGITLSEAMFKFLRSIDAGKISHGIASYGEQAMIERFSKSLDFDLMQVVGFNLADKVKVTFNKGTPVEADFTAENQPIAWLDATYYDDLFPPLGGDQRDEWTADNPYSHIPNLEIGLGKLVWFVGYTSTTILNTDFHTIMKANLQKNVQRTRRNTIIDKQDRGQEDESPITAPASPGCP